MRKAEKEHVNKKTSFDELFLKDKTDPPLFEAIWYSRDGNLDMYFMGYRNATKILLNWFLEPNDDNGTVYPFIFLIRHTIELGLKESIRRAKLLGFKPNSVSNKDLTSIWSTHDLRKLSYYLMKLLETLKISEYGAWNEIKEFLYKWQDADPSATFGKYPSSNKGVPYEVKGNISANKITVMGLKTIEILDNILSMLEDNLDMMNESQEDIK
jgi:hypothetical protein